MDVSLEWAMWGLTLLLMATTILPVKFAAEFVGAKRTTLPYCALAVILASAMTATAFYLVGDSLETYLVSFLIILLTYRYVLAPPPGHSAWLAVVALAVQLGIVAAFVSYKSYAGNYSILF